MFVFALLVFLGIRSVLLTPISTAPILGVEKEKKRTGGGVVEPPNMTKIIDALEHKDPGRYGGEGDEFRGYVEFFFLVGVASQERSILGRMMKGRTTYEHLKDKWAVTLATVAMFIQHAGDVTNILHNLKLKEKKSNNEELDCGDSTKRGKGFTKVNEEKIARDYDKYFDYFRSIVNVKEKMDRIAAWEDAIGLRKLVDETSAQKRALASSAVEGGGKKSKATVGGDADDQYRGCLRLFDILKARSGLSKDDGSTSATSRSSYSSSAENSQGQIGDNLTVGASGGGVTLMLEEV